MRYAGLRQEMVDMRIRARAHAYENGEDVPEITQWQWGDGGDAVPGGSPPDTGGDNG